MHSDVRKAQLQILPADEGQPQKARLTVTIFLSLLTPRKITLRSDLSTVRLKYVATMNHMPGQVATKPFAVTRIAPLGAPSTDPSRDPLRSTHDDLIAEDNGRIIVTAEGDAPPSGAFKITYSATYSLDLVGVFGAPPVEIQANPTTAELRPLPGGDWEWEAP